jgi:hypothetical protein
MMVKRRASTGNMCQWHQITWCILYLVAKGYFTRTLRGHRHNEQEIGSCYRIQRQVSLCAGHMRNQYSYCDVDFCLGSAVDTIHYEATRAGILCTVGSNANKNKRTNGCGMCYPDATLYNNHPRSYYAGLLYIFSFKM